MNIKYGRPFRIHKCKSIAEPPNEENAMKVSVSE